MPLTVTYNFLSCKEPSTNCTGSCISGCFCKPGFVFRGKRCVPIEKCGCLDEDNNYYEPGEIVFGNGCSKLCRCAGNYTLSCVDNTCDPTEECRQVGGIHGCYPKDTSTCIASGDPHYTTFDKRKYNFMGNCTYLMSEPCNSTDVPHFAVYVDNENRYNIPTVSYDKLCGLCGDYNGNIKDDFRTPSGELVNSPTEFGNSWNTNPDYQDKLCGLCGDYNGNIKDDFRTPSGELVNSPTEFGNSWNTNPDYQDKLCGLCGDYNGNIKDDFRTPSGELVNSPTEFGNSWNTNPDYQDKLCGLCGDYNGNIKDDFRTPSGELVNSPTEFGNSWNTNPDCNKPPPDPIPGCTDTEQDLYESPAYCGIILDSNGPFAVCHSKVNPNSFFQNCVFDLCALGGPHSALCEAIEAYVNECQDRGVSIGPWRNSTFCRASAVGGRFFTAGNASWTTLYVLSIRRTLHY
ncbi:hypothetical protein PGIGA_G00203600 [Pangasianodon gigas]|uniref:Uncharacterized protein n=1 Tax=Pangasianodon gigas TaxID=30993 RepID=A0ACC5WF32_PANGG|nr:hypothetical protein [Pangasianodon gigas]